MVTPLGISATLAPLPCQVQRDHYPTAPPDSRQANIPERGIGYHFGDESRGQEQHQRGKASEGERTKVRTHHSTHGPSAMKARSATTPIPADALMGSAKATACAIEP